MSMKFRPILFSGPMVRAILNGSKTQTRRVVKPQPMQAGCIIAMLGDIAWKTGPGRYSVSNHQVPEDFIKTCPYGLPGDRLWVRETWSHTGEAVWTIEDARRAAGNGKVIYRATDEEPCPGCWWPSIYMPREFSRITLEVVAVRVERLQDISGPDCLAEGVTDELIKALLWPAASKCVELDEHWVHGGDEGISYCHDCCVKAVEALKRKTPKGDYGVDGGWGSAGDSTPFCETCGARLSNTLTDYGASEEFAHFLEYGCDLKSPDDCASLLNALNSYGWHLGERTRWDGNDYKWNRRVEIHHLMWKACFRVLWESINGSGSWAANPWVWVVEFKKLENAA